MWIDRVVELVPRQKIVTLKNISLAEEHMHDHFEAETDAAGVHHAALPIMPSSLIVEGMAQSAGILVGHAEQFSQKVALAKIGKAEFDFDAVPGQTLIYTATIQNLDRAGASTQGTVEVMDHVRGDRRPMARIDLMFSHLDNNMAGVSFPEGNFVFGEAFKTLLRTSGIV
jgi:3-hydroxyacyl-[acyl-carrier-protein] dehydratase